MKTEIIPVPHQNYYPALVREFNNEFPQCVAHAETIVRPGSDDKIGDGGTVPVAVTFPVTMRWSEIEAWFCANIGAA